MKTKFWGLFFILSCLGFSLRANPWPEESIFNLESEWTRHDGKIVKLSSLKDRPQIVSMVFLSCAYSCPITLQDMREMEAALLRKTKKDFGLVLISIDPDRDTPEQMRKFAETRKLDLKRWTILTSTPRNIRELAAVMGFSYKPDEAMEFAHSMLTWVFDTKGVMKYERVGQKQTNGETAEALLKLLK